jgi:uncharacterized Zn-binding protein involved in type VI secretion
MVTGTTPHVGGPIMPPGVPTVLIGGQPAATLGNMATCTGPPDSVVAGSTGVMIGGKPAARMGDQCAHGGTIVAGCPTVLIGEKSTVTVNPDKLSWIEFQLEDHEGNPIAHEEFEVVLPDGTTIRCISDENGFSRIAGIDPGDCKIRLL